MAHRHKAQHKAHGGSHEPKPEMDSGNTDVEREAFGKKHGGKVHHGKHHAKHADGGKVVGRASGGRLDKRARGGGVGADKNPFSSAHRGHKRGGKC